MKKNLIKCLSIGLTLTMFLTACGGGAAEEVKTSEVPKEEVVETASSEENTLPEAEKLNVLLWDRSNVPAPYDTVNNPLTNWVVENVKKDTNIDIEYVSIPRSESTKKLNVMLTGNNAPDVVFNYSMSFPANFGKQGGLTDLGPYIEEYGPNIKKYLAEQLPYGVFDGVQYAIPAKRVNDVLKHGTYVRQDILDKYNLEKPTTKEEFYNALKVVKENEPDMIPYAMATTEYERYYENFVMSYSVYDTEKDFMVYNSDDIRLVSPGVKEGYRELNKWYNEGLISPDFVLDDSYKQYEADISNAKVFSFTDDLVSELKLFKTAKTVDPNAEFTPVNAFQNHEGKYFFNRYEPIGMYIMVPKASEAKAPAAIRFLDWMIQEENLVNVKTGLMLDAATVDEDGIIETLNDDELKEIGLISTLFSDVGIIQSTVEYDNIETHILADIKSFSTEDFDGTKLFNEVYAIKDLPDYYTVPRLGAPTDAEAKFGSSIRSSIKAMSAKLIACKPEEFDSLYESEYKSLLDSGLSKILEEREVAYNAMN